ncbi:hypothetical protein ACH4VR_05425 [Streptomyces sp. NPDC020883]|uniref:hypothetical protein n=1 Tax=Streptomyces sp. NPDC020883 TaxID=3365099 RepID=UPI0037A0A4F6
MNDIDWTGELAALHQEEHLYEQLRSDVGLPPDSTVDRAIATVREALRPYGPQPHQSPDAPATNTEPEVVPTPVRSRPTHSARRG